MFIFRFSFNLINKFFFFSFNRNFMNAKITAENSKSIIQKMTKPQEKIVSDGIVKWRRQLPEVSTAEAYEKFDRFMMKNRTWVEQKKLSFQQNESRKNKINDKKEKRIAFSQQKSFSCRTEDNRRSEHFQTPYSERNPSRIAMDVAEKRMGMAQNKKKSYSLDEKETHPYAMSAQERVFVKEEKSSISPKLTVHQIFEAFNDHSTSKKQQPTLTNEQQKKNPRIYKNNSMQPNPSEKFNLQQDLNKNAQRKKTKGCKSQNKKLAMLHDFKAVNESACEDEQMEDGRKKMDKGMKKGDECIVKDNEKVKKSVVCGGKGEKVAVKKTTQSAEEDKSSRRASMSCRLPIARFLAKFKMERTKK